MFLKQNDQLQQAKQDLYSTEHTAISIKQELHSHSEKLSNNISRVQ